VAGSVLVVNEDLVEADRWAAWLEEAGFLTVLCAGPHLRPECPRLHGASCILREAVDAAVIAVAQLSMGSPRLEGSCTRLPDDGSTIRIQDGRLMASIDGVGAELGPLTKRTLIVAVRRLRRRALRSPSSTAADPARADGTPGAGPPALPPLP
jgi:hypothetical protein